MRLSVYQDNIFGQEISIAKLSCVLWHSYEVAVFEAQLMMVSLDFLEYFYAVVGLVWF